jgi:hypothetical protein
MKLFPTRSFFCLGVFLLFPSLFACATNYILQHQGSFRFPPGSKILILPWENFANYPGAGELVADLIALELKKKQNVVILDRQELELKLSQNSELSKISRYGLVEGIALGRSLQVQYVIGGIISEMGYLREHRGINEKSVFAGLLWIADPWQVKRVASLSFSSRLGSDFLPQKATFTEQIVETLSPYLEEFLPRSSEKSARNATP